MSKTFEVSTIFQYSKAIVEPKNMRERMKIYFRQFIVRSYDKNTRERMKTYFRQLIL